jgi:hypothetical protein
MAGGQLAVFDEEKRYIRRDGNTVWARVTANVVRDGAGRPLRNTAVVLDITAHKAREEKEHLLMREINHREKYAQRRARDRSPDRYQESRSFRRALLRTHPGPFRQSGLAGADGQDSALRTGAPDRHQFRRGWPVVVGKILDKEQYNYGFDAQNGEYGNLMTKGIIDPTKVVRAALRGAASVAGLLITTEAMVAEVPRKHLPCSAAAWTSNQEPSRSPIGSQSQRPETPTRLAVDEIPPRRTGHCGDPRLGSGNCLHPAIVPRRPRDTSSCGPHPLRASPS